MLSATSIGLDWALLPAVLLELAPTTLPATLLILAATAVNLGAGSIAVRALAGRPYRTVSEAVLGGMTGALRIDAALMTALGSADSFRWPVIGLILGAILLAPIAWPSTLRPIVRPRLGSRRSGTGWLAPWLLAAVIWCLPLILILAAPIVTWNDVPANHVAPPEHLRFYGSPTRSPRRPRLATPHPGTSSVTSRFTGRSPPSPTYPLLARSSRSSSLSLRSSRWRARGSAARSSGGLPASGRC